MALNYLERGKSTSFRRIFEKVYWLDNSNTPQCPFQESNTVFLISYAIIMLNSDHHRANVGKRAKAKMSKEAFLRNLDMALAGEDDGYKNLPPEYLGNIFDSVESNPIQLLTITSGGGAEGESRTKKGKASSDCPHSPPFQEAAMGVHFLEQKNLSGRPRHGSKEKTSSNATAGKTGTQQKLMDAELSFSNPLLAGDSQENNYLSAHEECERHQRVVGLEMQEGEAMLRGMRNYSYRFPAHGTAYQYQSGPSFVHVRDSVGAPQKYKRSALILSWK